MFARPVRPVLDSPAKQLYSEELHIAVSVCLYYPREESRGPGAHVSRARGRRISSRCARECADEYRCNPRIRARC
jgi:hypothetical protein